MVLATSSLSLAARRPPTTYNNANKQNETALGIPAHRCEEDAASTRGNGQTLPTTTQHMEGLGVVPSLGLLREGKCPNRVAHTVVCGGTRRLLQRGAWGMSNLAAMVESVFSDCVCTHMHVREDARDGSAISVGCEEGMML